MHKLMGHPAARPVLLVCLALISAYAAGICHFRTPFEAYLTDSTVTWTAADTSIQADRPLSPPSGIEIKAQHSGFQRSLDQLEIWSADNSLTLPAAKLATLPNSLFDWASDQHQESVVYEKKLPFQLPLRIRGTLRGRGNVFTVSLKGEQEVRFEFRHGQNNHDLLIVVDGQAVASNGLLASSSDYATYMLSPFLYAVSLALILVALLPFLPVTDLLHLEPAGRLRAESLSRFVPWILTAIALALGSWTASTVLERLPHFQDDFCYLLRAKWFLTGHLWMPAPEHFEFFEYPHTYVFEDKWYTLYPMGWPLLLALGELFGQPWLVSPLCGAVSLYFLYQLGLLNGNRLYAAAAALLYCISPITAIIHGSMLSHACSAMFIIVSYYASIRGAKRGTLGSIGLGGLLLGFAFCVRPLTSAAVAIPLGLYCIYRLWRRGNVTRAVLGGSLLLTCYLIGAVPQFIDNYQVTGNAFTFAYTLGKNHQLSFEISQNALQIADYTLAQLPVQLFGWGWMILPAGVSAALSYTFLLLPFAARRYTAEDVLFLGLFLILVCAYLLHDASGAHAFGPRFYFEAVFALCLLTARGFSIAAQTSPDGESVTARQLGIVIVFGLLALSTLFTLSPRIYRYQGFNGVDRKALSALERNGVDEGVIIVERWQDVVGLGPRIEMPLNNARFVVVTKKASVDYLRKKFPDLVIWKWSQHHRELKRLKMNHRGRPLEPADTTFSIPQQHRGRPKNAQPGATKMH